MSPDTHVLALIEEGNPIPDPDQLTVDQELNQLYLTAINRRNVEATMLDTETRTEQSTKPRSRTLVAIAAVVAIVVGVAWVLLSQNETEVPPAVTPTTLVSEVAPTFEGFWADPTGTQVAFQDNNYFIVRNGVTEDQGTFTFLESSANLRFRSNSLTVSCMSGDVGGYDFIFPNADSLQMTVATEDCGEFERLGQSIALTRTTAFGIPQVEVEVTTTIAAGPIFGPNGFEVFIGQDAPGTYETDPESRFRPLIFSTDGSWGCVHSNPDLLPAGSPICGSHGPVFELDSSGVVAGFLVISETGREPAEVLSSLRANSEVVVGGETEFVPESGDWSSVVFTLDAADSAPSRTTHCGTYEGPCAGTDLINPTDTEATHHGSEPTDWAVSSTQTIWLITLGDGSELVAIAWFEKSYVPPEEDVAALAEAATAVISSLNFPG